MNQMKPLLGQMLQKIAPRIGASVVMDPEWNIAGQITFANGRKRYFRYSSLDLNGLGASDIAKDKDYANFFLARMDYPVIEGKVFYAPDFGNAIGRPRQNVDAAYAYASKLGMPVVVKPNSGSQGVGVAFVRTKKEFYVAMRRVFKTDRVALVQRPVAGKDYRIVVLDDKIISAYERIALSVVGDGRATVSQLLARKQKSFVAAGRDTSIRTDDPRIDLKLQRQGLSRDSVLEKGRQVFLLDNANLSTGGDAVDVTKTIHPGFKKIAVRITRDMGLRLCGVDLMVNGDITQRPGDYRVIEINSAPGLDHYAKGGTEQERIVEDLYLEVLKSLAVAR